MEEELNGLSDGEQFDVIMACHKEAMHGQEVTEQMQVSANVKFLLDQDQEVHTHSVEDMPVSVVVFDDDELCKEYLCFMSEEELSHGLTDKHWAHTSVKVPLTNKCQLDQAEEERETTVKCQQVLSPSPTGDIGALITATSQSFLGLSRVGLPPDLVQQIIMIDSSPWAHELTDSGMVKIWDISDKDEEDEPEFPADMSQWWGEFKNALHKYLKDHQPVVSLLNQDKAETSQCDLYQVRGSHILWVSFCSHSH